MVFYPCRAVVDKPEHLEFILRLIGVIAPQTHTDNLLSGLCSHAHPPRKQSESAPPQLIMKALICGYDNAINVNNVTPDTKLIRFR